MRGALDWEAIIVLPRRPGCDPRPLVLLGGFFVTFWLGPIYHVIPMFTIWGVPTSMGCYLYAVAGAEVALCVAGLRVLAPPAARRFVAPAGVALFALLDLYTIHMIAIPYYTGLIAHRPNGPVAAFYPGGAALSEALPRLASFKSPWLGEPLLMALWIAYVAATLAIVYLCFRWSAAPGDNTPGASPS